ncbi:MAG: tryptophan--tRNA ligase, partial [Candidatus Wildermuthbacteria bacterium]|nr:tryptophan--tRNA ligase [Candidatus Wildermuthbacteria bacterium]
MRILSGIQPTGQMHIGNYLGAGLQYLEYQDKGDFFLMVADLHALTVPQNPKTFGQDTLNKALELLAIGIDPAKCTLFVQSHVKEHAELAWILNTITPLGELERMTQYKDKSKKHKDNINAGLLDYPVLMAADILLYKTDVVPVGQDQTQHLELTRTLAKKFNSLYGETFPEPKTMLVKEGAKIMSLLDPKKKMSKSDNPDSFIAITDDPETIKRKVAKAVTDTGKDVRFDLAKKPGISNLL